MEIAKNWREQPTNMRFEGVGRRSGQSDVLVFRYPGGSIPLSGEYEEIIERFLDKGFSLETTEEILLVVWGRVAPKATISFSEVIDGLHQFVGGKVRE